MNVEGARESCMYAYRADGLWVGGRGRGGEGQTET